MPNFLFLFKSIIKNNSGLDKFIFLFRGIIWAIRKRLKHHFLQRLWNGAIISVRPANSYSPIFYFKYIEGLDLEFIRENSYLSNTFVDVGTNVGLFSASLFDKFKTFILIEPSSSTFTALMETVKLNQDKGIQFITYNIACSDSKKIVSFSDVGNYAPTNRIISQNNKLPVPKTGLIKADTLDNIIGNNFINLILKIDVEGHEENVFLGAKHLFSIQAPKLVMFERLGRTNLPNILDFMNSYNYKVFRVIGKKSISTEESVISEELINLFACPESVFNELLTRYKNNI